MSVEVEEQKEEQNGVEQNEITIRLRVITSHQQQFQRMTEHHDELDLRKTDVTLVTIFTEKYVYA